MKSLVFFLALFIGSSMIACTPGATIPSNVDLGPAPTSTQITDAVNRWTVSVSTGRRDKLVIENVKLAGPRAWKRNWADNKLTGKGAGAFPQKEEFDYGYEVTFTATIMDNDGRMTRKVPQSVLLINGGTPRAKFVIR